MFSIITHRRPMQRVVEVLCSKSKIIDQSTNIQRRTHYHQQWVNLKDGPHIWLILVHSVLPWNVHMSTAIVPIIQLKVKLKCLMLWTDLQCPAHSDRFIFVNWIPNVIHGQQIQNSHGRSYKWVHSKFLILRFVCILLDLNFSFDRVIIRMMETKKSIIRRTRAYGQRT